MSAQNFWFLLPTELVQHILVYCDPRDVASFSGTSTFFRDLVYSKDSYLWRQLMLANYDDPQRAHRLTETVSSSSSEIDWKTEVQNRSEAEIIAFCYRWEPVEHVRERRRMLETFVSAIKDALPASLDGKPSLNVLWLDRVLRESMILQLPNLPNEAQLCSRMRSYIALTHNFDDPSETDAHLTDRRTDSRCFVYDFRRYGADNHWGPFFPDQSINWVHVEALVNVIVMNIRELPEAWFTTMPPLGLEATRAFSAPDCHRSEDWAGVEGSWRRYVCFMDYRDLFAFNYANIAGGPRNPSFFKDSRFREAARLIEVKLHLISRDQFHFDNYDAQGESSSHPLYPMLYFAGESRGLTGPEANIEGHVKVAEDGTIRWRFYDTIQGMSHSGRMQWCSHGIQLGNAQSAMGIIGNYSTKDHDEGDPVGPFWLFKVQNNYAGKLLDFV